MPKQDLIRLIIILLIAGSGALRWVFVKLQEQAAKKKVQDELERRRIEALRTGQETAQVGPDPEVERGRAQAEAAARRQAQIEEFRKRQQERARQRAEVQRGPFSGTNAPTPGPAPTAAAPPVRPARLQRAPRQLLTPSAPEASVPAEPQQATHRLVANQESRPLPAAARAALSPPQTPEQWRRAIIVNTLLSPPPGLGTGDDPWSPVS